MFIIVFISLTMLKYNIINYSLSKLPRTAWASKSDHATLETVLFGSPLHTSNNSNNRLQKACSKHRLICKILLCAYESLQTSLETFLIKVPSDSNIQTNNHSKKLDTAT